MESRELTEDEVDPLSASASSGATPIDMPSMEPTQVVTAYEAIMSTVRSHAVNNLTTATRTSSEKNASASTPSQWGGAEFWQDEHWRTALDELFYKGKTLQAKEKQDDMIFYAYEINDDKKAKAKAKGKDTAATTTSSKGLPLDVTVRRFRFGIPKDLPGIQWMESVYLNILLHTEYTCTVAICSKTALEKHRKGEAEPALPVYKTSRQVYASHTHISINLNEDKGAEPEMAYPQIYFSIDDFENAFEDLVVQDEDHCMCVLLYARDGPTFKWKGGGKEQKKKKNGEDDDNQDDIAKEAAFMSKSKKVSLFSGYVPYSQLFKVVSKQSRGSHMSGFLGMSSSNQHNEQPEKLVMRGPGGKGMAEVAVTLLNRKSVHTVEVSPPTPQEDAKGNGSQSSKEGKGLKSFFSSIQSNASQLASNIGFKTSSNSTHSGTTTRTTQHIRCCLMNVSLPWQSLCHDILKASQMSM